MKKILRTAAAAITALSVLAGMTGCATRAKAADLMDGVKAEHVIVRDKLDSFSTEVNDFAVRLFNACDKNAKDGENTLVSPISVLLALSMTANGARGETLAQLEDVLGLPAGKLNDFALLYMQKIGTSSEKAGTLELANSIWLKTDPKFEVNRDFLQKNADYYSADIYSAPFDDSTVKKINTWVDKKTKGMIPSVLNTIPEEVIMYLINALSFEAEWIDPYIDYQVRDDRFVTSNGETKTVPFLHRTENNYLEDDNSTGFIKYYMFKRYAFVAILPNEGVIPEEYLQTLTGDHLTELLSNVENCEVRTSMPKFKTEYSADMSDILKEMGMPLAFDKAAADFSGLGTYDVDGNIFINSVIHKTFIQVDEKGTKAGAVTMIEAGATSALSGDLPKPKEVYLTRPFIYMLIDCESNTPFFIGVMRNP